MEENRTRVAPGERGAPTTTVCNEYLISDTMAARWVDKGIACSAPLLRLAGQVADPRTVAPQRVTASSERVYGDFMLTWLVRDQSMGVIQHIPDARFFMRTLRLAYEPLVQRRPDLDYLLNGVSRTEVAFTNDVLQIQLHESADYSMIRHHALMLFYATLWLEEPERSGWLALYDEALEYVVRLNEGGEPGALKAIELNAFEDLSRLSSTSVTSVEAELLLSEQTNLLRIAKYNVYAAAAIGLLWREYRELRGSQQNDWHRKCLSLYPRQDFLAQKWVEAFKAPFQRRNNQGDSHG